MAKEQKMEFYNKASFGFYVLLKEKEKKDKKQKKSKLSHETMLIAGEIGNLLAFKNIKKQNAYLGTIREFCNELQLDIIVKAVKELIRAGYLYSNDYGLLGVCSDYFNFKEKIEIQIEEKKHSSTTSYSLDDFKSDLIQPSESKPKINWCDLINRLKYQIEVGNKAYTNFYNGAYKCLVRWYIEQYIMIDTVHDRIYYNDEAFDDRIKQILSIYFKVLPGEEYKHPNYIRAKKHIEFFTEEFYNYYKSYLIQCWKSGHPLLKNKPIKDHTGNKIRMTPELLNKILAEDE
jgi:hypothetical protein